MKNLIECSIQEIIVIYLTRFRAASGGPRSPFGFEEAFKGGRGIQGGKFFKKIFFQLFKILRFYNFVFIPGSWGVHRYPWFQNWSINMARGRRTTRQTDILCALSYRCASHVCVKLTINSLEGKQRPLVIPKLQMPLAIIVVEILF